MKKDKDEVHLDPLPFSLQESVLAALCFQNQGGAVVAAQLNSSHFDGPHRVLAAEVIRFRNRHHKRPSRIDLRNMLERLPITEAQSDEMRDYLDQAYRWAKTLTPEYLQTLIVDHCQRQTLKGLGQAIIPAFESNDREALEKAWSAVHNATKQQFQQIESGSLLSDVKNISRILRREEQDDTGAYSLGIEPFDNIGLKIRPGTLLLYIGAKNTGKSWACIHVGKNVAKQNARVLHVTLEMSEDQVTKRYIQSFFSIATNENPIYRSDQKLDKDGRSSSSRRREIKGNLTFKDRGIRREVREKVRRFERRLSRIRVKEFASGSLTVTQLSNYLDYLEQSEHWTPDVLIIDYPDLMKLSQRDLRLDLGRTYVDLRGLANERHMGLFCPTQGNRMSFGIQTVKSRHIAEDISKVMTADNVLVYSQTELEKERGLARLQLEHAREIENGLTCVLSQAYGIGQFALEAFPIAAEYLEQFVQERRERRRRIDDDDEDYTPR